MTHPEPPQSVADLLCRLIAIPSVNPMGRTVDPAICLEGRLTDWLEQFFHSIGAPCERWEVAPGRFNIIARHDASSSDCTILLDAHQDTVPVDGMTVPPFEAVLDGGRITGRGACDVKGGLAAMLFAFRRLVQERPAGSANVVLSCTCDEEATTLGIRHLVDVWTTGRSRLLPAAPDFAIIAEPTLLDVVVAHRGVQRLRLATRGLACHSSDPSQGVNAIYRMAKVLEALEEYAGELAAGPAHPLCGAATLSVGRIDGGVSVNIVPDACVIEIDRRLVPGELFADALENLKQFIAGRIPFPVEFDPPWLECPPLGSDDNAQLARALLDRIAVIAGPRQSVGVQYGTHAAYTSAAGVPSVVCGPGSIAQAHTKNEFIDVSELNAAAEVYFSIGANPPEAVLHCQGHP